MKKTMKDNIFWADTFLVFSFFARQCSLAQCMRVMTVSGESSPLPTPSPAQQGTQSLFPGGLITSATHHRGHYAKGSHPFHRRLSISWFCVLPHYSSCLWIPFPAISPIFLDFSTIACFSLNAILHLSALPIERSTAFYMQL